MLDGWLGRETWQLMVPGKCNVAVCLLHSCVMGVTTAVMLLYLRPSDNTQLLQLVSDGQHCNSSSDLYTDTVYCNTVYMQTYEIYSCKKGWPVETNTLSSWFIYLRFCFYTMKIFFNYLGKCVYVNTLHK